MECQPQTSKSARHRNCRVKLKDDHPSRPLPASELPSHIASPTALNLPCSPPHSHSVLAYRKVYQANTACTFSALHRSHCACLSLRRIPTTNLSMKSGTFRMTKSRHAHLICLVTSPPTKTRLVLLSPSTLMHPEHAPRSRANSQ